MDADFVIKPGELISNLATGGLTDVNFPLEPSVPALPVRHVSQGLSEGHREMVRNIADAYPHHPWTWVCRRFLEQVLPPSDDPDDLEKSITLWLPHVVKAIQEF